MKLCALILGLTMALGAWAHEIPGIIKNSIITYQGKQVELLTSVKGLTLYTFDPDAPDLSNCSGQCLRTWPALVVTAEQAAKIEAPFSTFKRADGTIQVSFETKPLYFFIGDKLPGDLKGDGLGGVWHIAIDEQ